MSSDSAEQTPIACRDISLRQTTYSLSHSAVQDGNSATFDEKNDDGSPSIVLYVSADCRTVSLAVASFISPFPLTGSRTGADSQRLAFVMSPASP